MNLFQSKNKKTKVFSLLIVLSAFVSIFGISGVLAASPPTFTSTVFYGTLKIDLHDAPIGTYIIATVEKEPRYNISNITTKFKGNYSMIVLNVDPGEVGKSVIFSINNRTKNIVYSGDEPILSLNGTVKLNLTLVLPPSVVNLTYPVSTPQKSFSVSQNSQIKFNWTASSDEYNDSLSYIFQLSDEEEFTTPLANSTVSHTNYTAEYLADNLYLWRVYSTDGYSYVESLPNLFFVDTSGPAIHSLMSNDTDNVARSDSLLNFSVTAGDINLHNVTLNNLTISPFIFDEIIRYGSSQVVFYNLSTPSQLGCSSDGVCILNATANDWSSKYNTTSYNLVVDDANPSIISFASNDTNNITRTDSTLNITISFSDANADRASINGNPMELGDSNLFFISKTPSQLGCSQPSCALTATIYDKAGNSATATYNLILDDLSPKLLSFNSPIENSNLSGIANILKINAFDNGTGIKNVTFKIGTRQITAINNGSYWTEVLNTTSFTDGLYNITAIINDFAENREIAHALISEVMFDPDGGDSGRVWIEIYNPSSSPINLSGWTLKGGTKIITLPDFTLQPRSTAIIANSTKFMADYGFSPELDLLNDNFDFTNSNDFVQFKDSLGAIVDEVSWGNNDEGNYNWSLHAASGKVIARNPVGYDADAQPDWQPDSTPTPGKTLNADFITVIIDNTPPAINFFNVDNKSIAKNLLELASSVNDATSGVYSVLYSIKRNNGETVADLPAAYQSGGNNLWTVPFDTKSFDDGRYNLTITAVDYAGNNASTFLEFIIDNNAPASSSPNPSNNSFLNTTNPILSLALKDNASGIVQSSINLSYLLNGGLVEISNPFLTSIEDGFNISFPLGAPTSSVIDASVQARDYANHSVIVSWRFGIDTETPKVNSISVNKTSAVFKSSDTINLSAEISDEASGVSHVTAASLNMENLGNNAWSINANAPSLGCVSEGACTIQITAYDNIGYVNGSKSISIIVDDTNPRIENAVINNTIISNSTPMKIEVSVNDANFGAGKLTLKSVSSVSDIPMSLSGSSWAAETTAGSLGCQKNGNCSISIIAEDSAGNINSTERILVSVDSSPPSITEISINDSNRIVNSNSTLNIILQISDENRITSVYSNTTQFSEISQQNWSAFTSAGFHCNSDGISDGECFVYLTVSDNLSNSNSTQSFSLIVDNTAPSLESILINGTSQSLFESVSFKPKDIVNLTLASSDYYNVSSVSINQTQLLKSSDGQDAWQLSSNMSRLCGNKNGICSLEIESMDNAGNSIAKKLTIRIERGNEPPTVIQLPDIKFNEDSYNDSIHLDEYLLDEDNSSSQIKWSVVSSTSPNVTLKITPSRIVNFTASANWSGSSVVTLSAYDGTSTRFGALSVTVNPINDAPLEPVLESPPDNSVFSSGISTANVTLTYSSSDIDSQSITYYIFQSNSSRNELRRIGTADSQSFKATGLGPATYYWAVIASDGFLNSSISETRQYNVTANLPPHLDSVSPFSNYANVTEGSSITFSITKSDPENNEMNVTWLLDGAVNQTGTDTFDYAPDMESNGDHTVKVIVADKFGAIAYYVWLVRVGNVNQQPIINIHPTQTEINSTENLQLGFKFNASDFDGEDSLVFGINRTDIKIDILSSTNHASHPELLLTQGNFSADFSSGYYKFREGIDYNLILNWIPKNSDVGVHSVKINATDTSNKSDTKIILINVSPVNDAPIIANFSPPGDIMMEEFRGAQEFNISVSDIDSSLLNLSWKLNGTLLLNESVQSPGRSSFNLKDIAAGFYELSVEVNDGKLDSRKSWNVLVRGNPVSSLYQSKIFSLNKSQLESVSNVTISAPSLGMIDFGEQVMNLSGVVDVDSSINISKGIAAIDTLKYPQLNKPALITMKGFDFKKAPYINFNDGFGASGNTVCPPEICSDIIYDSSTGTLSFKVSHFSTYFTAANTTNDPPRITSQPPSSIFIGNKLSYQLAILDLDNSTFIYTLQSKPDGMEVSSNGMITWTPASVGVYSVVVQVSDGMASDTQSFSINALEPDKLSITDIDVKIDGKTSKNIFNNTIIAREAAPGSTVDFKINVANGFLKDGLKINDIEVTATIEGIEEDGDDSEKTSNMFDLRAQDDKTVTLSFNVPINVDEDIYDVVIDVDGKDSNSTKHDVKWKIQLDVNKNKHKIIVNKAELSTATLKCRSGSQINVELLNLGEEDEDDVILKVSNNLIGINSITEGISMDSGTSSNSYSKTVSINVPSDIEPGIYPITVTTYREADSGETDSKTAELKVEECIVEKKTTEETSVLSGQQKKDEEPPVKHVVEMIVPPTITTTTLAPATIKTPSKDNREPYIIFLLASISIMFLLIVAILSAIIINGKRKRRIRSMRRYRY